MSIMKAMPMRKLIKVRFRGEKCGVEMFEFKYFFIFFEMLPFSKKKYNFFLGCTISSLLQRNGLAHILSNFSPFSPGVWPYFLLLTRWKVEKSPRNWPNYSPTWYMWKLSQIGLDLYHPRWMNSWSQRFHRCYCSSSIASAMVYVSHLFVYFCVLHL